MESVRFVIRDGYFGRKEELALLNNAKIMNGRFRNFSGEKEGEYDQPGKRYFNVFIENPVVAQDLADHDYAVSIRQLDDGSMVGYLKVHVKPESPLPCIVKVKVGEATNILQPEDYAILDGLTKGKEYDDTLITSAKLTLRIWEYRPGSFTCQLEEGIFNLQPISYWDDKYAEEEFPHE